MRLATDSQVRYLHDLAKKLGEDEDIILLENGYDVSIFDDLSSHEASELIDSLKGEVGEE
jgi:hypothetical protein